MISVCIYQQDGSRGNHDTQNCLQIFKNRLMKEISNHHIQGQTDNIWGCMSGFRCNAAGSAGCRSEFTGMQVLYRHRDFRACCQKENKVLLHKVYCKAVMHDYCFIGVANSFNHEQTAAHLLKIRAHCTFLCLRTEGTERRTRALACWPSCTWK